MTEPVFQRQERAFWYARLWKCREVQIHTVAERDVYWASFSNRSWPVSADFTFGFVIEFKPPFDQTPLFKFTLELNGFLLCPTIRNVILRDLFSPNRVMDLMKLVPSWARRSAEHDSWKVHSHAWAGRLVGQEQVAACAGVWLEEGILSNALLPSYRHSETSHRSLTIFLHRAWESSASCSPAACLDTF